MMDIFEVGTGGGSIAGRGRHAARRPAKRRCGTGPACYGLGGAEPAVTDAVSWLRRIGADRFLAADGSTRRRQPPCESGSRRRSA
jgi:N-methylhydantoinase A